MIRAIITNDDKIALLRLRDSTFWNFVLLLDDRDIIGILTNS